MKDNKLVLKYCPNFYKIMNMDFQEGDNISTKLVDIYEILICVISFFFFVFL